MTDMDMREPPAIAIESAISIATKSPCQKSKRGAAIWMPEQDTNDEYCQIIDLSDRSGDMHLVSTGHNRLPVGTCTGSSDCRATCGKRCEHAEAAAIRWARGTEWPRQLELLHVKVVHGVLVASGKPSCWQCSKAILADGRIAGVWLFHQAGWLRYTAAEFHALTLEGLGIIDRWRA